MPKTIYLLLLLLFGSQFARAQCPTGVVVTVTNNFGSNTNGSFAWALDCLDNAGSSLTTVQFDIDGATVIQPIAAAPLSVNKSGAIIDGANLGSGGSIVIDGGSAAGPSSNGLIITQTNVTIQGLIIRNFTGSSGGNGVLINSDGASVQTNTLSANRIGIATSTSVFTFNISGNTVGESGAGNTAGGISIAGAPTAGIISNNEVAHNTGAGINISGGTVLITNNSIYCNSTDGINRGAVPEIPIITLASTQLIRGTAPVNRVVEVFIYSTAGCAGAPVQGKTYLGTVTTPASGIWTLALGAGSVVSGDQVTATSTQNANNTSEFSVPVTVGDCAALVASINQANISCFGSNNGSAAALPTGIGVSYEWSNNLTSASISNLSPGTYTVTVTNSAGCSASQSATIIEPALLSVVVLPTIISCFGANTGSALATVSGGTLAYAFVWSNGQTSATASNLVIGTYTVTVTDMNACTKSQTVSIAQAPALALMVTATGETISGANDGTVFVSASGGTSPFTFKWSTGNTTAQVFNLPAGTYTVTVTDQNNCSSTGSATVSTGLTGACTSLPVYALLAPAQVCGNTSFTLEADDLYPNSAVKYVWKLPNGDSIVTTQPTLALIATSSAYSGAYYVLRDSAGCRSFAVGGAIVTVVTLGNLFAGNDSVLCSAGQVSLLANLPASGIGSWVSLGEATVDAPNQNQTLARNLQPGRNAFVWQVALDNCPQAGTDTVVYFLENKPSVKDDHYTLQRAFDVAVMEVLLNDALGGLSDTVLLQVSTPSTGQLELLAGRRFRYTVDEDFRGTVTFQYAVCTPGSACNLPCDTATVTIDVLNMPTVPSGLVLQDNGPNGAFTIRGINGFTRVEITITDRWGDLVFREMDYDNDHAWVGDYKRTGQFLPGGAYYYFLKAYDGEKQSGATLTGVVHLFDK